MKSTTIASVRGRRVWDSRGRPTVEAEIRLAGGARGLAIAPAGASTGSGEALDRRDGGTAFGGYDVTGAVGSVNTEIAPRVIGMDAADQGALDAALIALDGTANKSRLGANATLAVSMAAAHAAAHAHGVPLWQYLRGEGDGRGPQASGEAAGGQASGEALGGHAFGEALGGHAFGEALAAHASSVTLPLPQIQILGGGAHAGRRVDIQDFLVICPAATSFAQALDWTAEVYRATGSIMKDRGLLQGVADEGGWWPAFTANEQALETLVQAIERAGFTPGAQVAIALDIAATDFGRGGRYRLGLEGRELDTDGMIRMLLGWIDAYPIASIEDPLAEDDAAGFAAFTREVGHRIQVVGDDFLVSDAARVRHAAAAGAANTVLIKPNQRGTLSETRAAWDAAKDVGYAGIVSARSGETEDVTIVHLALGWGVGQLKVGSFARSERMAKWNEALRIEEALGPRARFAGGAVLGRSRR
jgi:enolase